MLDFTIKPESERELDEYYYFLYDSPAGIAIVSSLSVLCCCIICCCVVALTALAHNYRSMAVINHNSPRPRPHITSDPPLLVYPTVQRSVETSQAKRAVFVEVPLDPEKLL